MVAVARFSRGLPLEVLTRVLSIMGLVAVGFTAFALFTSNPFERLLPGTPGEGSDLNPLLQDPGLIIHPRCSTWATWVSLCRLLLPSPPCWVVARCLLGALVKAVDECGMGIPYAGYYAGELVGLLRARLGRLVVLGSSGKTPLLCPLVGTALVHSLAVTEKRGLFRSWTVLMAIAALFPFLARDFSRALWCAHLGARVCARPRSRTLYSYLSRVGNRRFVNFVRTARAYCFQSRAIQGISREALLLFNNLVFCVSALTVLLGTLFPLVMDALGQGKYSVGPPYFNAVFVPLMALLVPLMVLARYRDGRRIVPRAGGASWAGQPLSWCWCPH